MAITPVTETQALAIKSRFEPPVVATTGVTGVALGQQANGDWVIRVDVASSATATALPATVKVVPVEVMGASACNRPA